MKYYCKCGKEVKKSTNAGTTSNNFKDYGPGHECFGCPFVCKSVKYDSYNSKLKKYTEFYYECRMSQAISYESYCQGLSDENFNTSSIFSLDVEFLNNVANTANTKFADGFEYQVKPLFEQGTDYSTNGMYKLTLTPTKNKKGKEAKQGIRDMFFDENGKRKDWNAAQERIIVLSHIENEKQRARGCVEVEDKEMVEAAAEIDVEEDTEDSTAVEGATLPAVPNIEFEQSVTGGFDYSTVDEETAEFLIQRENLIKENTANYATQLGKIFKEAQDKMASHYQGGFEKWYNSLCFSKKTVYNLIDRYTLLSRVSDTQLNLIENLPLQLSYAISAKGAPAQLVQGVMDGDITTNAEFQKLRKQLEDTNSNHLEMVSLLEEKIQQTENESNRHLKEKLLYQENLELIEKQRNNLYEEIRKWRDTANEKEQKIKELESRPIDVAVEEADPQEIERLVLERTAEKTQRLREDMKAARESENIALRKAIALEDKIKALEGTQSKPIADCSSCWSLASDIEDSLRTTSEMFFIISADLSQDDFKKACSPIRDAITEIAAKISSITEKRGYTEDDGFD